MKKKSVLSLFSGCGGMDLGFEGGFNVPSIAINPKLHQSYRYTNFGEHTMLHRTSFETVFANDILGYAEASWKNFFSNRYANFNEIFRNESIVELVKEHKSGNSIFPNEIDVITGGFPCQDFSVSGKRGGFNSHKSHQNKAGDDLPLEERRGKLYWWMREVISLVQPKVFIAENVKGLISLGEAKKIIQSDFSTVDSYGYLVVPAKVLNAADYGVSQNRERIIFIGLNKKFMRPSVISKIESGGLDIYPPKTHSAEGLNGTLPYVPLYKYLNDLDEPAESNDLAQKKYSKAKYCKGSQGQVEVNLHGLAPTIRAEHHGNIEYRRLNLDKGGKYQNELEAGLIERRLTVRECARIQTFPDSYEFVFNKNKKGLSLSASGAYKVIGNAVPPLLAYNIAAHLENIWELLFVD